MSMDGDSFFSFTNFIYIKFECALLQKNIYFSFSGYFIHISFSFWTDEYILYRVNYSYAKNENEWRFIIPLFLSFKNFVYKKWIYPSSKEYIFFSLRIIYSYFFLFLNRWVYISTISLRRDSIFIIPIIFYKNCSINESPNFFCSRKPLSGKCSCLLYEIPIKQGIAKRWNPIYTLNKKEKMRK